MTKQILFDLDGTLTDSGPGIMQCMSLVLTQLGLPVPQARQLRFCVGPPLRDSFRHFGVPEAQIETAVALYREYYHADGQFRNEPYPGIPELLQQLKSQGHRLYVATSKPEIMSVTILERFGLAGFFDRICGATADPSRNTKEAVIAWLLAQLTDREALVMVGDTIYDVLGAQAHGIPTIGVTWGYGDAGQMHAAGARLADSTEELLRMLNDPNT